MDQDLFDKPAKRSIVGENQSIKTPPDGAGNTNRGLTSHADSASMTAERNNIFGLSSRQSLPTAVDDFYVESVEYCPPTEETVTSFVQAVMSELDGLSEPQVRQGFRQFIDVLISIQTKAANNQGGVDDRSEEEAHC